jgi:hypothetical protein
MRGFFRKNLPVLALACGMAGLALGCGPGASTTGPTVTGFTPAYGPVQSTTVTVTGTGFSAGINSVTVGDVASAAGSVASDTSLSFTVPSGAMTGPIVVNTPNGSATTAANFIVVPGITSVSPTTGPAATLVTITGSGLAGITGISFVGTSTSIAATIQTQTANQITVPVPAGVPLGELTVVLTINPNYGLVPATVTTSFTATE